MLPLLFTCGNAMTIGHTRPASLATSLPAQNSHVVFPTMPAMPPGLESLLSKHDDPPELGLQNLIQAQEPAEDVVLDTNVISAPAYPNTFQNDFLRHWGVGSKNATLHASAAQLEQLKNEATENAKADMRDLRTYMASVDETIRLSNEQIVNATKKRLPSDQVAALVAYVNQLHKYKEQLAALELEIPRGQMQYEYQLSSYKTRMGEEDEQQKKREDMSRTMSERLHRNDMWVANKTRHLTWNGYTKYDIDKAKNKPTDMDLVSFKKAGEKAPPATNQLPTVTIEHPKDIKTVEAVGMKPRPVVGDSEAKAPLDPEAKAFKLLEELSKRNQVVSTDDDANSTD